MNNKIKQELLDLCIDVYAHANLDWEITLCGNGVNSFENTGTVNEILRILEIERDEEFNEKVEDRMIKLKSDYE